MVFKKATVQVMLLLAGIAMLIFGIWREEAQTVFSKAKIGRASCRERG